MWRQGQHCIVVGSTDSGKTTLLRDLLRLRGYVVLLVNKRDDLIWTGYQTVSHAKQIDVRKGTLWRLHPAEADRRTEFHRAMAMAKAEGGWTVGVDELYFLKMIGLESDAIYLLTEGRSDKITIVGGLQRPSWFSRFAFSETRHFFGFRLFDERDVVSVREITGSREFASELRDLERFQFAHLDRASGRMQLGTRDDIKTMMEAT